MSEDFPRPDTPFREAIRRRPGMYVGNTHGDHEGVVSGLMTVVLEVAGNAFDQHLLGQCSAIHVAVDDDVITVRDDGPGLPLDTDRSRRVPGKGKGRFRVLRGFDAALPADLLGLFEGGTE